MSGARYVGHPQLIRGIAAKDTADEVKRGDLRHSCSLRQPPGREPLQPDLAHDRPDGVVADDNAAPVAQLRCHPHVAVGAAGGLVDIGDLTGQIRRRVRGGSGRPFQA